MFAEVNNCNSFGSARDRENKAIDILADIILGSYKLHDIQTFEQASQLGYLATLAKGIECDNNNQLRACIKHCRAIVERDQIECDKKFTDQVQASWGAKWHVDATKIRRELPLRVMKKRQIIKIAGKVFIDTCLPSKQK